MTKRFYVCKKNKENVSVVIADVIKPPPPVWSEQNLWFLGWY